MLNSDCVSLASSDVAYKNLSDTLKAKGEYQFLKKSLSKGKHGIHQGVYIVTPSGKLIKQIGWGWPLPDVDKINAQLKQSITDYQMMSRAERLGDVLLTEKDRSMPVESSLSPPRPWLQLRNTTRSYQFSEMNLFDIRHPAFVTVDKLWFSGLEKLQFVPSNTAKGTLEKVAPKALNTMLLNSHLITGRSAWWAEHIQKAEMEMKVVSSTSKQVVIYYRGTFNMHADSKWCKESYVGKLLGKAAWNPSRKQFTSFEWVSLGEHEIDELKSNMHRGSNQSVTVASRLVLDPQHECEQGIAPANWPNNYARELRAEVK
jgi:hypothetical protein